ncbi:MAG TPA: class F sortase [Pseudonocardiaceae bacterium]|nr:class F sortase [Pseudonocardiaceae bacterium]
MRSSNGQGVTAGSTSRRRRQLVAATFTVVLGLGGASMVGYALDHQEVAPQPSSAADPQSAQPTAPSLRAAPLTTPVLPASTPTSIHIPAIKVSSPVTSVGLNPDHTMEVPQPGPHYNQAAWYRYSPTPGEIGPSVIIGHIDSAKEGPSVFFRLGALKAGQQIEVGRVDGTTATFQVDSVASFSKHSFPTHTVYGDTDFAALRLITCGGSFDRSTGNYVDNIVVFAHLLS